MRLPRALFGIAKEAARHLLRRPVAGLALVARTATGDVVLIRRGDTGEWALPGGTLEWGETLRACAARELAEETGCALIALGRLVGVYSAPARDPRFHAVTVVVEATVGAPELAPMNPLEVLEVRSYPVTELPSALSHGMTEMLHDALRADVARWE